ncbi:MFS transporter [candidate division TA06 bacterium]|uniref:MFS transporter n=1 Tax=candidate division TA06 bacterium TaxID=2250710 RepID=A0A660S637_UNCT6|nr:MAG: MFS transporter [candidate division TA06 bacterium]
MKKNKEKKSAVREMMRYSILEGAFAQIFLVLSGPGSVFITKFAIMLGATPIDFGILTSIGRLSDVFQLFGMAITKHFKSRKAVVLPLASIGRGLVIVMALIPLLIHDSKYAVYAFLLIFFFSASLQSISANAWIAWISDMIPVRIRGRFFSRRNQYLIVIGTIVAFLASFYVDIFDNPSGTFARFVLKMFSALYHIPSLSMPFVFLILFVASTVLGLIGVRFLSMQPENRNDFAKQNLGKMFKEAFKDKNFRKFLIYNFWWMFAIGIASPFWQPFMIKKLGMSLASIQIYGLISTLFSLISLRYWGEFVDRFGNKTAMKFAIILGGINPMVWVFVKPSSAYIIYFEAAMSGIMWSGVGVIAMNFVLSIAPKGREQIYSGVLAAFSGIAITITAMLSGILYPKPLTIGVLHFEPEQILFAITGVARWSAIIPLMFIREYNARPMGEAVSYLKFIIFSKMVGLTKWRFRNINIDDK